LSNPQDKDKGEYCLGINREKEEVNYKKIDYSLEQRWFFSPSLTRIKEDKNMDGIK
jgi:hypothetical protein